MVHASNSTRESNRKRKKRSSSSTATDCDTPLKRKSIEATRPPVKKNSRTASPSLQGILAKKSKQKQAMYKRPAPNAKYSEPRGYKSMRVEVPPNFRPKTSKRQQSRRYDDEDDDYDDEYVISDESEASEECEESDCEGFQTESENGDDFEGGFASDHPEGEEVDAELNDLTLVDQNEEATGPQITRKFRGSTKLKEIHDRSIEERQTITLNALGQPIGDRDTVGKFSRFIGTLARKKKFAPVIYPRWKELPDEYKKDTWEYVLGRYDVPEEGKRWVMETFRDSWSRFKSRVKKYLYTRYETFEERLANCPKRIPQNDAKIWLEHLEKEDVKEMCLRNKENRKKYKFVNRAGPISHAVLRNEWKHASEEKQEPDETDFFVHTRKARIKPLDEETTKLLAELEELKESGDKSALDAKLKEAMGNEHPGFVRLYGRCVTKTALKHASAHKTSMAERQQERQRLKDELRAELKQETIEQLRTGFQMFVSCLQESNPSMVIPANMPNFPMDNRNPDDSSSAPRPNGPTSSAATNSPSGVLPNQVQDGS